MMLDVTFDFTTDSPNFWEGYRERNEGLGAGGSDPDKASPTLKYYHQQLWSRELPNGEIMKLESGDQYTYLQWKDFCLSSDSIIISLRYWKYKYMLDQVNERLGDFKPFMEDLIHKGYTIGGMMLFPQHTGSINQAKGWNRKISDRWDLTLECIRRYYNGEDSPLYKTLVRNKAFFDLFVDFKGYVDFFFLQDCVSDDYSSVDIWCGDSSFAESGLPKTIDDYFTFIDREVGFLNKRNQRIYEFCVYNGMSSSTYSGDSTVQQNLEEIIRRKLPDSIRQIEDLAFNKEIVIDDSTGVKIVPDFYSEKEKVIGEIHTHLGALKAAQKDKIAADVLKMQLLEKRKGYDYRKFIIVCDKTEEEYLKGKSYLVEAIRAFRVEVICITDLDESLINELRDAMNKQNHYLL